MLSIVVVIFLIWTQSLDEKVFPNGTFGESGFFKSVVRLGSLKNRTSRNGLNLVYETTDGLEKLNSVEERGHFKSKLDFKFVKMEKTAKKNDVKFVEGSTIQDSVNAAKVKTCHEAMFEHHSCCSWCKKTHTGGKYFLSAVLLVRIYSSDLAKLSTRELHQWLFYLRFAGVEHVYLYDAYVYRSESQKDALGFLINEGFVTYVDWNRNAFPYSISGTQQSAYQDCLEKWGNQSTWQASIDMDEYPFCPKDTKPNFIQRFIADFSRQRPEVSQITMKNFLFLGKPADDKQHPLLIDRLKRRTHKPANHLVKPIYKTSDVKRAYVHHHDLAKGISLDADESTIRLNHYWGGRLQNWGDDTPEILAKTREDTSVKEIVENIQSCYGVCLPSKSIIDSLRWN